MKRRFLVLALAALVAGGAFADSMFSLGGGFSFSGGRIGRLVYDSDDWHGTRALGFGGHVFFDATFVEASIGIMGGPLSWVDVYDGSREVYDDTGSLVSMELSLLGKFPIAMGESATFFPLLGIGASIALSASDPDGESMETLVHSIGDQFSTFRLKFGLGADFDITERVFFRAQGLGWYGFAPSAYRDWADIENAFGGDVSARGGFGGSVRLAVGFRL